MIATLPAGLLAWLPFLMGRSFTPTDGSPMINIRWFKVLNDLAGNKTRTLLIVLSMAVGLFAVGVILSARSILSLGLAESFAAIHPSSGVVRTGETFAG